MCIWVQWMRMCTHNRILKILTENRIDSPYCNNVNVIQVKMKKIIATDENQIFFKKKSLLWKLFKIIHWFQFISFCCEPEMTSGQIFFYNKFQSENGLSAFETLLERFK